MNQPTTLNCTYNWITPIYCLWLASLAPFFGTKIAGNPRRAGCQWRQRCVCRRWWNDPWLFGCWTPQQDLDGWMGRGWSLCHILEGSRKSFQFFTYLTMLDTWQLFTSFFSWHVFFVSLGGGLEISHYKINLRTEITHFGGRKNGHVIRIIISKVPITLGEGRPLFTEKESAKIQEVSSKPLSCGILQVTYACT